MTSIISAMPSPSTSARRAAEAALEAIGWMPPRYTTTAFEFAATSAWWCQQLAGWIGLDPTSGLLAGLPPVYDQHRVGSCTAQALACAVETVARRCGYQPERPSRRDIYFRERRMEGTTHDDAGAILADGVTSLTRGWLPESRWPHATVWGPEWTTAPPALPVDAPRVVNAEALAITVDDVIWEIASGHPVVVGLEVTDAWETLTGDRLPDPEGSSIGGHAVCLVGFELCRGGAASA